MLLEEIGRIEQCVVLGHDAACEPLEIDPNQPFLLGIRGRLPQERGALSPRQYPAPGDAIPVDDEVRHSSFERFEGGEDRAGALLEGSTGCCEAGAGVDARLCGQMFEFLAVASAHGSEPTRRK